jgi:hypothetical protein
MDGGRCTSAANDLQLQVTRVAKYPLKLWTQHEPSASTSAIRPTSCVPYDQKTVKDPITDEEKVITEERSILRL